LFNFENDDRCQYFYSQTTCSLKIQNSGDRGLVTGKESFTVHRLLTQTYHRYKVSFFLKDKSQSDDIRSIYIQNNSDKHNKTAFSFLSSLRASNSLGYHSFFPRASTIIVGFWISVLLWREYIIFMQYLRSSAWQVTTNQHKWNNKGENFQQSEFRFGRFSHNCTRLQMYSTVFVCNGSSTGKNHRSKFQLPSIILGNVSLSSSDPECVWYTSWKHFPQGRVLLMKYIYRNNLSQFLFALKPNLHFKCIPINL